MRIAPGYFQTTNAIFAAIPEEEFRTVRPFLTRVRLVQNQPLIEHGQPAEHVFFVEEGITSLVAGNPGSTAAGTPGVQVAMIGREGLVGALALLGEAVPYASAVVQVPGPALRISLVNIQGQFAQCPVLHRRCLEYIQTLTRQVMSIAVSNASNTLAERCVRWLLMTHDRMDEDDLPVTHEALSSMLGVRRSGVTVATAALQDAGLIRTRRGRIRVLDRAGLEAMIAGTGRRRRDPSPLNGGSVVAGAGA